MGRARTLRALRKLLVASHRATAADLPGLASAAARRLGVTDMVIYLADYSQHALVRLVDTEVPSAEEIPIAGTVAGRAFALSDAYETAGEQGYRLWLPLLDGTERLGVLAVLAPEPCSKRCRRGCELVASMLSELVVSRRHYGDTIERTRRRLPMQLAAEIVWNLLPPLTFTTDTLAVSAILEPCYDVGGDAFDYAVNGDVLSAAVFDTVGHGIDATAVTSLAVNAYRNARRCGLDLAGTHRSVDKWVGAKYPHSFVTAVMLELDIRRGLLRRICAGHPGELLLRAGRVVKTLPSPTTLPLGLGHLTEATGAVSEEALQPGDQLLVYTDGVVEARTEDGEFFGPDRLADYVTRALAGHLSAAETMRRLVQAILEHQHEHLQDDATAVLIQWQPSASTGGMIHGL
jgi:phosphoserine phosphatase RsbU/P